MGAVGLGWGMDGIKKNMGKRAEGREFNKLECRCWKMNPYVKVLRSD